MPVSGVLLQCAPEQLDAVGAAVSLRTAAELRGRKENALIVVTDTDSLDADRAEVEALSSLDGVLAAHVVFSSIEDLP
jgi:nitrate reductase NapAB chaperone NapD